MIRLDWVHACAAQARWCEEAKLLQKEARRVVVTFNADSQGWVVRRDIFVGTGLAEDVVRGYKAYCLRQSYVFDVLSTTAARVLHAPQ